MSAKLKVPSSKFTEIQSRGISPLETWNLEPATRFTA